MSRRDWVVGTFVGATLSLSCHLPTPEATHPLDAVVDAGAIDARGEAVVDAAVHAAASDLRPFDGDSAAVAVAPRGMIAVPGGEFEMGSADGPLDERPPHRVAVSAFAIDATEVTVQAYAACIEAGVCRRPPKSDACNIGKGDKSDHPMNCVDWNDANRFCSWSGYRLPTEEEWEYVARGDGRRYPWGNVEIEDRACWNRHRGGTCPVGSRPAGDSPLGVHDLAGNVWEWTSSAFASDYAKPRDRSSLRVTRGGGFGSADPTDLRTTTRGRRRPEHRSDVIGFRCAK